MTFAITVLVQVDRSRVKPKGASAEDVLRVIENRISDAVKYLDGVDSVRITTIEATIADERT